MNIEEIDGLLRTAITERRLVTFYDRRSRKAEPHDYGIKKSKLQLLCFQIEGESRSGKLPDWRLLEVPRISELEVLNERFPDFREVPSEQHKEWDILFATVSPRAVAPKSQQHAAFRGAIAKLSAAT